MEKYRRNKSNAVRLTDWSTKSKLNFWPSDHFCSSETTKFFQLKEPCNFPKRTKFTLWYFPSQINMLRAQNSFSSNTTNTVNSARSSFSDWFDWFNIGFRDFEWFPFNITFSDLNKRQEHLVSISATLSDSEHSFVRVKHLAWFSHLVSAVFFFMVCAVYKNTRVFLNHKVGNKFLIDRVCWETVLGEYRPVVFRFVTFSDSRMKTFQLFPNLYKPRPASTPMAFISCSFRILFYSQHSWSVCSARERCACRLFRSVWQFQI